MAKQGVSTRLTFVTHKHGIRLNKPHWRGFWWKVDRWLFGYGESKGLPCFLPMVKLERQLVVDGKPIFSGGGVNCFGEDIPVYKVTVNKQVLQQCKEAYETKEFKVRNYEYNGFMGKLHDGYAPFVAKEVMESRDGGVYEVLTDSNTIKFVPSYAIEGIQIMYQVRQSKERPSLFGVADAS